MLIKLIKIIYNIYNRKEKELMKQTITSKDTSIKQVSAVYTNYKFEPYSFILDIGCGKYHQDTVDRCT